MSNKRPPSQAKFTRAAIDGAARELARFDCDADIWDQMGDADHNEYRRDAEKILNAARDAIRALTTGKQ